MNNSPTVAQAALRGLCPRCGKGPMFKGYLDIAPKCTACGLDYSVFDVGDGASVFVILIAGFLVAGAALVVEATFSPPYWVHAILWIPIIFIVVFTGLRLVKAVLVALQYKHQAREGKIAD